MFKMGRIPKIQENKCIGIFEKILGEKAIRNKGVFDFLIGDKSTRLPVDAFFPVNKIVVEYMGEQHFKDIEMMNQRPGRKDQRKRYDNLRRALIPQHGFKLILVKYNEPLTEEYLRTKL